MSFEDIKGQDKALDILKEEIQRERIFSAYLFIGPDGVGKKKTALNFAKAINCLSEKDEKPCETCLACTKINANSHPDVFLIEPKGLSSSIGIEEIKTVIARSNLKPYEAKRKVFIIDDAHAMNQEASNAFLKTLEEPPKNTIFILISRLRDLLLPTIISRCHSVNFFTAPPELILDFLVNKNGIGKEEAGILRNFCSGRIGEAIRMHEKGMINRKNIILDSLLSKDKDFSEIIGTYSDKKELKDNLEFIISFFRDIFLYKALRNNDLVLHSDRIEDIKIEEKKFTPEKLEDLIKKLITLCSYIDYNVNTKVIIDVLNNEIDNLARSAYA